MIDMEQTVYDILTVALPGMKWSVGFPQDFRALGEGLGSIKQMDNTVRTSTSSGIDRISNVAVQVQGGGGSGGGRRKAPGGGGGRGGGGRAGGSGRLHQSAAMNSTGRLMRRSPPLASPAAH